MSSFNFYQDKIDYQGIEDLPPLSIEKESMSIISKELEAKGIILNDRYADVIKRCIHTSADFDYAHNLAFSDNSVEVLCELLKKKPVIVTDTNMALSGISSVFCKKLGIEKLCFMADEEVGEVAKKNGVTRAIVSIDKACQMYGGGDRPLIFAIGNAPTALVRIRQLFDKGLLRPSFVIGVPVGFVNVVRAKELIMETSVPYIIAKGNKGGSNIAAAIVNAALYRLDSRE